MTLKTDSWFQKWHKQFGDCFCRKYVMFEIKKIKGNCVMKNDLKNDMKRIWWNFTQVVESNNPLYIII